MREDQWQITYTAKDNQTRTLVMSSSHEPSTEEAALYIYRNDQDWGIDKDPLRPIPSKEKFLAKFGYTVVSIELIS